MATAPKFRIDVEYSQSAADGFIAATSQAHASQKGLTLPEPVFPQYPEKLANPGLERVSDCEWFGSGARAEPRGHQKRRPASLGTNVCGTRASFH
jgi:hypothetical protein